MSVEAAHPRWETLGAYVLLGVALLLSWLAFDSSREIWDAWDETTYLNLNGSLAAGGDWLAFWAVCNSRYFDLVPGVLTLALYATYLFEQRGAFFAQRFKFGLAMATFTVLWLTLVIKGTLETERASPSLVYSEAIRIGKALEWVPRVKDYSDYSFPGDHAAILLLVSVIILHVCGRRRGAIALVITVLFALPRLVGGAHWLSDVVVGGGFAAFTGAAVFLGLRRFLAQHTASAQTLRHP